MSMQIAMGAGWNGDSFRTVAELAGAGDISPLAARIMKDDAEELRARAIADRDREQDRQMWQERQIAASIELARDRGEQVSIRDAIRSGGIGRTHAEILEWHSAMIDMEDARQANDLRRRNIDPQDLMEPVYGDEGAKPASRGFVPSNPEADQRYATRLIAREEATNLIGQAIPGIIGASAMLSGQMTSGVIGERGSDGGNW